MSSFAPSQKNNRILRKRKGEGILLLGRNRFQKELHSAEMLLHTVLFSSYHENRGMTSDGPLRQKPQMLSV